MLFNFRNMCMRRAVMQMHFVVTVHRGYLSAVKYIVAPSAFYDGNFLMVKYKTY